MTDDSIEIVALQERPQFRETVSDRIWKAWWREAGHSFDQIDERVRQSLHAGTIPVALVAARGGEFLGTVSLIDSDMDERPDYGPWVAALWVDAEHRGQGIGAALVRAAAARAFTAGYATVYLCATPENSPLYLFLGWRQIEADVGGLNIFVQSRCADRRAAPRHEGMELNVVMRGCL